MWGMSGIITHLRSYCYMICAALYRYLIYYEEITVWQSADVTHHVYLERDRQHPWPDDIISSTFIVRPIELRLVSTSGGV